MEVKMSGRSYVWSLVFVVGLIAIYVGERLIGAGIGRSVATSLGVLLTLGATAARATRPRWGARGSEKPRAATTTTAARSRRR